jgi:hypothetical protein
VDGGRDGYSTGPFSATGFAILTWAGNEIAGGWWQFLLRARASAVQFAPAFLANF